MWVKLGRVGQTDLCCGGMFSTFHTVGPWKQRLGPVCGQKQSSGRPLGWHSQLLLSLPDRETGVGGGWGTGVVVFRIQIPRPHPI